MVLVDENWGIGYQGKQPLFLKEDLKRFQQMTMGKTVIFGRKTLATFPQGKPLKNRRNLILSRQENFTVEGGDVCHSVEDLLSKVTATEEVVVIGGATVYQELLPYVRKIHVTKVNTELTVDTYFPKLVGKSPWKLMAESPVKAEQEVTFRYLYYEAKEEELSLENISR